MDFPVSDADQKYQDMMKRVLQTGEDRMDRTGVGTRSLFGEMVRFDLSDGRIPLLTTKRVFWKTAFKEMLWFLTGGTNIRELLRNNVKIWTDWPLDAYRKATGHAVSQTEFEEMILADERFAAQWGELGPVYGKQWRRWVDAQGREHDQIATLIETLRANPSSRRMLFHAWNVGELDQMALPPCHMVYQFHVNLQRKTLSCMLLQRSADLFTGVPFNWVSGAALTYMVAQQAGLAPGELIWVGGDVHIYSNHRDQVEEQLRREPRSAPRLRLTRRPDSIDHYRIEDFVVEGYDPHPAISAEVAV